MRRIYTIVAVTMAGVSSVFALLAELNQRYALGTSNLGWIAGSAFAAALLAQLWLARYADRGHTMLLLRGGVIAAAIGLTWFAAATELWQFIAARAILGAGVGMILPAARRTVLVDAEGQQGARLGVLYASYLSGFVFGPPIAGILATLGDVRLPFVVLATVTAASVVSLTNFEIHDTFANRSAMSAHDRKVLRRLLRSPRVVAAILVVVSFRYSIGVFEPLWAVHLDAMGASTTIITASLIALALPMLIIAKRAGRLSDKYGARLVSVLSAFATVPIMASYGYMRSVPGAVMLLIPHGILEAVQSPGAQAAIAEASPTGDSASAQGLAEAAGSAAAAIGALTAAPIFAQFGAGPAWLSAATVMAVLLGASALIDPVRIR